MLLTFKTAAGKQTTLGPLEHFRFDREELRERNPGPVLARHEGHHWQVAGDAYLRLDYDGPISVSFEDPATGRRSREFGPFMHLSSVDGMTYLNHELFCQFNSATGLWYVHAERSEWPSMLVKKAQA